MKLKMDTTKEKAWKDMAVGEREVRRRRYRNWNLMHEVWNTHGGCDFWSLDGERNDGWWLVTKYYGLLERIKKMEARAKERAWLIRPEG